MLAARLMLGNKGITPIMSEVEEVNSFVNKRIKEIEEKYDCTLMQWMDMGKIDNKFVLIPVIDLSKS